MRAELRKLKNKRSYIFMAIVIIIPLMDLGINWYANFWDYLTHPAYYEYELPSYILHPSKAAFLSGSTIGHLGQMLLVWMMPIYLLLIYSGSIVTEIKTGYLNIIYTKKEKAAYVKLKLWFSFLLGFGIVFISLSLNFILACILFKDGFSYGGMEEGGGLTHPVLLYTLKHPYLVYFGYIMSFSVIVGVYNLFCTALAFQLKNKISLYPIACFIWMLLIMNPFSITYAIQPFIEFGLRYILVGLGLVLAVGIIGIMLAWEYKRRRNEII